MVMVVYLHYKDPQDLSSIGGLLSSLGWNLNTRGLKFKNPFISIALPPTETLDTLKESLDSVSLPFNLKSIKSKNQEGLYGIEGSLDLIEIGGG